MLDRPVWSSLTTSQRDLSIGDALARRYAPDVNRFASALDDEPTSLAALAALLTPDDPVFILQVPPIALPPGVRVEKEAQGVQLVYDDADLSTYAADDAVPLDDGHATEMLALATLTEPGPFLTRTHRMGRFWGVFLDGRLAAMAGERMRFPDHCEVSGVCTHPDFRGRGLARRLSAHVTRLILARDEVPFLHAWSTNEAAIGLYESLGFRLRARVNVAVIAAPGRGPTR